MAKPVSPKKPMNREIEREGEGDEELRPAL
jgi:hypothetical protein